MSVNTPQAVDIFIRNINEIHLELLYEFFVRMGDSTFHTIFLLWICVSFIKYTRDIKILVFICKESEWKEKLTNYYHMNRARHMCDIRFAVICNFRKYKCINCTILQWSMANLIDHVISESNKNKTRWCDKMSKNWRIKHWIVYLGRLDGQQVNHQISLKF